MDRLLKNVLVWIAIIGAIMVFYKFFQAPATAPVLMDSNQLDEAVRAGRVARVRLPRDVTLGGDLNEKGPDGKAVQFVIAAPGYRELVDELLRQHVAVEVDSRNGVTPMTTFLSWLPMLALIGIWLYFMRNFQAAARNAERQSGVTRAS
jgi:cell division protease FtsH